MARLTNEETQRIEKLENQKILSRDMTFYTHLEEHKDNKIIEKLKNTAWGLRVEFDEEKDLTGYKKDLKALLKDKFNFIKKNYSSLENILSLDEEMTNNILNNRDIEYLTFLLSTIFKSTFVKELTFKTIYKTNNNSFSFLVNYIKEHIEENYPDKLRVLQILAYHPNCNTINDLILSLKIQDLFDEEIFQFAERYKEYTLIENGEYFNEDKLFLEINLDKSDEEVLKDLKEIRKKLKYSRQRDNSKPRKISKAQEEGNILFIYDCQKLGLRKEYIKEQLQNYFNTQDIDFSTSNNIYNKYLTEIQNNLNN